MSGFIVLPVQLSIQTTKNLQSNKKPPNTHQTTKNPSPRFFYCCVWFIGCGVCFVGVGWYEDGEEEIEKLVDELVCIQLDKSDDLLEKSNYDELNRWHQKHFGCIPTYKVHDEGNGWYLCEITYNVPGNPTANSLKADGKTRGSAREEAANKVVNLLMYYGLWKNRSMNIKTVEMNGWLHAMQMDFTVMEKHQLR